MITQSILHDDMNGHTLPIIRLRALEPEDLDMLYKIENDYQLWGVGATNVPYSRYALHDYIAHASNDIYTDQQVRLIVENEDGETIGIADLTNFDPRHRRAEVGLVIMHQYRCRGYGQAVLMDMCRYARQMLNLHQLYAVIATDNQQSLRLFNKCGFDEMATLKDWLLYGKEYKDSVIMQFIL